MAFGAEYYQGTHRTQFDGGPKAASNCVPTALSDAARQVTRNARNLSGSQVRALVPPQQETSPATPGWSLTDAKKAATRMGIRLTISTGRTWDELTLRRAQGRNVIVQGVSAAFPDGCSGAFDGPHCIDLPPLSHSDGRWRYGDPICKQWKWVSPTLIRQYAGIFAGGGHASFAYTDVVPRLAWGEDVNRAIMSVDPSGLRVKSAVQEAGHDPGALVNMGDLDRALKLIHHNYGSRIDPSDVQFLLDWAASHA